MKKEVFMAMYEILAKKGIAGVSFKNPEIRVYVEDWYAASLVPEKIMGYETKVIVSGRFKILVSKFEKFLKPYTPVPGGVSCSHIKGPPGTLGGVVIWRGKKVWISNNHVVALCNSAKIGDPIVQPANSKRVIGRLANFVPIEPHAPNTVDAAIVEPIKPDLVSEEIIGIGKYSGVESATVGMRVIKQGLNCLTEGKVVDVGAMIKVHGYPFGYAIFIDQIITTKMAEPGDSGSLLLSKDKKVVGLVFAGAVKYTAANRIENVMSELGVSVPGYTPPGAISLLFLIPFAIPLLRRLRTR